MKFFRQLKNSIFDIKAYNELSKQKFSKCFLYVIMLSLILSVFIAVKGGMLINKGYGEALKFYNNDLPEFQFKNGILNFDAEMPIYAYDEETGEIFFIDTSDNSDESIIDYYPSGLFIFKDKAIAIKDYGYTISTFKYSEISSEFGVVEFEKKDIERLYTVLEKFKVLLFVIVFVGYFIFQVLSILFSALVYGVLSLIVNKIMKTNLKFDELYKISLYAFTLPTLIGATALVSGINIPIFKIIKFVIMGMYIVLIIKSIKENIDSINLDNNNITLCE